MQAAKLPHLASVKAAPATQEGTEAVVAFDPCLRDVSLAELRQIFGKRLAHSTPGLLRG